MNDELIIEAVTLRELNCISLDSLEDRILLQKKAYLAQHLGLELGYRFNWYIRGPYSPDLTAVAYELIPGGIENYAQIPLTPSAQNIVERVNSLANELLELTDSQKYELFASIAYLADKRKLQGEELKRTLKKSKPQYSDEQINEAYEHLMTEGIIKEHEHS